MAYVFDTEKLHLCSKAGVGLPVEAGLDAVTRALAEAYPGRIITEPRQWVFNNAGGAMGQMCLLYASLREYLILFGTPIGTEGHSGRYGAEVYDFIVDGEVWCYLMGETARSTYRAGEFCYLGGGLAKGYRIPDHAWMIEYARGNILGMLPFGLADTVTSTLDLRTFLRTSRLFLRAVSRSRP